MRRGFEVHGQYDLRNDLVQLWLHREVGDHREIVKGAPRAVERLEPSTVETYQEPSIEIEKETAIALITELWRLGYRPRTAEISGAGELEATRFHLEDLRRLVFKLPLEPR